MAEYVKRIRALRWLAMALRAQETAQARLLGALSAKDIGLHSAGGIAFILFALANQFTQQHPYKQPSPKTSFT